MVIEWLDPLVFRWATVGTWLTAALTGLVVCGGNYHKARDRRKRFFKEGPEIARQGVIHRHRIQKRLFIAMCAAATVGVLAAVVPRPTPPSVTLFSLLATGLLLWFIALISSLSVEVRRYEAEVIEVQALADDDTLKGIAAQFTSDGGNSLRDVVDQMTHAVGELRGSVNELKGSVEQMKANDAKVAAHLVIAQKAVDDLKVDLDASRVRADAVHPDSDPGAAADAASQSGEG